jgi:broad specificity phosphatase PhoE
VILLARHGETDDNRDPIRIQGHREVPLNATGREQAQALARAAAEAGVTAIWASTLLRARETATIVGAALGLEPALDVRLAETYRGDWEGRLAREIAREDPDAFSAWLGPEPDFRFPGGESLPEQQERVLAALADIAPAAAARGGRGLVVCHGGSIRLALCSRDPRGIGAYHTFEVPNGALVPWPARGSGT